MNEAQSQKVAQESGVMPYGFSMKHDDKYIQAQFENEEIWRTVKQTFEGREWSVGKAIGRPIDIAALGKVSVQITSSQNALEPMFPLKMRYAVSQTIRDFIESMEPGVHQFIPVHITLQSDDVPPEPYYLLNICNLVEAIDHSRSHMKKSQLWR